MSAPYVIVGQGRDVLGHRWEVGVLGPGLVVRAAGEPAPSHQLCFDGAALEEFARAVACGRRLAADAGRDAA